MARNTRRALWIVVGALAAWVVGVGGGGVARAGDGLIDSHWLGAADGSWWDADRWSNGFPHNIDLNRYRAIIDETGDPYTIGIGLYPGIPVWPQLSHLVLDSDDATLHLQTRLILTGPFGVADIHRGTLRLGPTANASHGLSGNANIYSRLEWEHGRSNTIETLPTNKFITVHKGGEAHIGGPGAPTIPGSQFGHTHELRHVFNNYGVTRFDNVVMLMGGAFTNFAGGEVVFHGDQQFGFLTQGGSQGRFINYGTVRLESDSPGTPIVVGFERIGGQFGVPSAPFSNHGVVNIGAHTLRLSASGQHSGVFSLDGGVLVLGALVGGTNTFLPGSRIEGPSGLVHIVPFNNVSGDLTSSVDVLFAHSSDAIPDLSAPGAVGPARYTGNVNIDANLTIRAEQQFNDDVRVGGHVRLDTGATFRGDLEVIGDVLLPLLFGSRTVVFEQGAAIGGDVLVQQSGARFEGQAFSAGGLLITPGLNGTYLDAHMTLGRFHMTGSVTLNSDVAVHDHFEWTGVGVVGGTGSITIDETASGVFQGGSRTTSIEFINKGDLVWNASGALRMNSPLFHNAATGVHTVNTAQISLYYHQHTINEFLNDGLFVKTGAGDHRFLWFSPSNHAVMNNNGVVEVRDGTLHLLGGVTQLVGSSLTGGTWDIWDGAALRFALDDDKERVEPLILTSDASVTLRGNGSHFPAFDSLAHNRGEFALLDGRSFETTGDLLSEGGLVIGRGSALLVAAAFALGEDATTTFHMRRDAVRGEGAPTHGVIEIVGDGALAGTLRIALDGKAPLLGESFVLLGAAALNGTAFGSLDLPDLPGSRHFVVEHGLNDVTLRVVPAPGAWAGAALGAAVFGGRRRRVEGADASRRSGGRVAAKGRRRIGVEASAA